MVTYLNSVKLAKQLACFLLLISSVNIFANNNAGFLGNKGFWTGFTGKYLIQGGSDSRSFSVTYSPISKKDYTLVTANSGSQRQILTINENITFFTISKEGTADASLDILRRFPFALSDKKQKGLEKSYQITQVGEQRIANKKCKEYIFEATDLKFNRYSQKICIDPNTGMALKQSIYLKEEAPLETSVFSEIAYRKTALPFFKGKANLKLKTSYSNSKKTGKNNSPSLKGLPEQFYVIEHKESGKTQHYVISDGLIYVSLIVDETPLPENKRASKAYYIDGALALAVKETKNGRVTALGFMPPSGLQELVQVVSE